MISTVRVRNYITSGLNRTSVSDTTHPRTETLLRISPILTTSSSVSLTTRLDTKREKTPYRTMADESRSGESETDEPSNLPTSFYS